MKTSGFCRDVDEICALLGYYAALIVSFVPTFRDNLSVPSSRIKQSTHLHRGGSQKSRTIKSIKTCGQNEINVN